MHMCMCMYCTTLYVYVVLVNAYLCTCEHGFFLVNRAILCNRVIHVHGMVSPRSVDDKPRVRSVIPMTM